MDGWRERGTAGRTGYVYGPIVRWQRARFNLLGNLPLLLHQEVQYANTQWTGDMDFVAFVVCMII